MSMMESILILKEQDKIQRLTERRVSATQVGDDIFHHMDSIIGAWQDEAEEQAVVSCLKHCGPKHHWTECHQNYPSGLRMLLMQWRKQDFRRWAC